MILPGLCVCEVVSTIWWMDFIYRKNSFGQCECWRADVNSNEAGDAVKMSPHHIFGQRVLAISFSTFVRVRVHIELDCYSYLYGRRMVIIICFILDSFVLIWFRYNLSMIHEISSSSYISQPSSVTITLTLTSGHSFNIAKRWRRKTPFRS